MEFNKSLGESVVFMVVLPCIDVGFHGSKKDFESLSKTRAKSFSVQGDCVLSCNLTFFVHLPDIFCQADVISGIDHPKSIAILLEKTTEKSHGVS